MVRVYISYSKPTYICFSDDLTHSSEVDTLYTALMKGPSNDKKPRNLCRKFGGWNATGMKQLNIYLKPIKKQRKNRQNNEEDQCNAWKKEAYFELSRKRKQVIRHHEEVEMAGNELFSDEDDGSIDEEAHRRQRDAACVAIMATAVTHAQYEATKERITFTCSLCLTGFTYFREAKLGKRTIATVRIGHKVW